MKYLNEDEIKETLIKIKEHPLFDEWFEIVKDILLNEEFQKRRLFKHHKGSVWDHSIAVSFKAFKCSKKNLERRKNCAIAGLLHDFYPYAWQYSKELEEYTKVLYAQARLIEGLSIDNPTEITNLICDLISK